MNVLVYDGSGVSAASRDDTLRFLRTFLNGRYDVQTVSPRTIKEEPWTATCALLVVPGGRDLPYCHDLGLAGTRRIREWVRAGGKYLGICAGAYFASSTVEFEVGQPLEVTGRRDLGFFDGLCKGTVFPGFEYDSDAGARHVEVALNRTAWRDFWPQSPASVSVFYNGGGAFYPNATADPALWTPLAAYTDVQDSPAAGVLCYPGRGRAVLWGVHPEHAIRISEDPVRAGSAERARLEMLRASLTALELDVGEGPAAPPQLSPLYLVSDRPGLVSDIAAAIAAASEMSGPTETTLRDRHDTFVMRPVPTVSPEATNKTAKAPTANADSEPDLHAEPKQIFVCDASLPDRTHTPLFDTIAYFTRLGTRAKLGRALFYGEVVTSTQTMLDRNDHFLACVPEGVACIASHQVAGRGRGGNSWISSAGCLQFSLVLRLAQDQAHRIVFVQYLMGLAVVEAIAAVSGLEQLGVCLKWPNDIYADFGKQQDGGPRYRKIGGILVNSSYRDGVFSLVVGCGVNVSNPKPTTSVNALIYKLASEFGADYAPLRSEDVLALVMAKLDDMWPEFTLRGFAPFVDLYLKRWIHQNEIVTLESTQQRVKIVGITPDHGLLRTVPLDTESSETAFFAMPGTRSAPPKYVDLQPDGNRFDILKGLISARSE